MIAVFIIIKPTMVVLKAILATFMFVVPLNVDNSYANNTDNHRNPLNVLKSNNPWKGSGLLKNRCFTVDNNMSTPCKTIMR